VVFSLSVLPPLGDYVSVYAGWMAVLFLVGYFAYRRFSSRHNATLYAVYLLLGATGALLGRYDLFPALLTVAAFWAASRRRFMLAYLFLAAGALLKLYPIALMPLLMIEHRRFLMTHDRPWRLPVAQGVAAVGSLVAASFALGFLVEGWNALSTFYYAAARPLQVESLGATLLWLGSFLGFSAITEHGWSSYNLVGPLDSGIMALLSFAGLAGLGWIYWRCWQGRLELGRGMARRDLRDAPGQQGVQPAVPDLGATPGRRGARHRRRLAGDLRLHDADLPGPLRERAHLRHPGTAALHGHLPRHDRHPQRGAGRGHRPIAAARPAAGGESGGRTRPPGEHPDD